MLLQGRPRRACHAHRSRIVGLLLGLASSFLAAPVRAQPAADASVRHVPYAELVEAMSAECRRGYAVVTTSNAVRFQAAVLRALVYRAQAAEPSKSRLLIHPRDYARAYMAATGLRADELPSYVRLPWQLGQYTLVDHGAARVVARSDSAPPALAISVVTWWPDSVGRPQSFSYVDTLARPTLRVTNDRVVTYRVLYFDDMVVVDDVHGIEGRPMTGVLGVVFDVIGDGRVLQSRSTLSRDGLQVTSSEVRKGFVTVTPTATIYPNGAVEKDVPPHRDDLDAIATRLRRPLGVEYGPAPRPVRVERRD